MKEFKSNWQGGILKYYGEGYTANPCGKIADVCLSSFLSGLLYNTNNTSWYEFEFFKGLEYLSHGSDVWCPFNYDEIIQTLEDIRLEADDRFEYQVEETEKTWIIRFKIKNCHGIKFHLYVITRIRYLYEAPQCCTYRDALTLRESGIFGETPITDIYNIIVSSIPFSFDDAGRSGLHWYSGYHSIPKEKGNMGYYEKMSVKGLSDALKDRNCLSYYGLNGIYKIVNSDKKPELLKVDWEIITSLAYWRDEIASRIPVYKYNFDHHGQDNFGKVDQDYMELKNRVRNAKVSLLDRGQCDLLINNLRSERANREIIKF
jgi:hypothetical protein